MGCASVPNGGTGWYQIHPHGKSSVCIAGSPFADSRDLFGIDCINCLQDPNRCLWSFTYWPPSAFQLRNKSSNRCLYSDQGELFVSNGQMHQDSCVPISIDSTNITWQREVLFFDDFGQACP